MNTWECQYPECGRSCTGVWGAIGLRTIGWQVVEGGAPDGGPKIFCPVHRRDGVGVLQSESIAKAWQEFMQSAINAVYGAEGG
jgi:hypothetical protein